MLLGFYNTLDGFMQYAEVTETTYKEEASALYDVLKFLKNNDLIKRFGTCVVVQLDDKIIYQCGSM